MLPAWFLVGHWNSQPNRDKDKRAGMSEGEIAVMGAADIQRRLSREDPVSFHFGTM